VKEAIAMKAWTVDDVMTRAVVSVDETASYRNIVDLLVEKRFSAVPVVDAGGKVIGVVSEADLLRKIEYAGDEDPRIFDGPRRRGDRRKAYARTASELMTTPPVVTASGTSIGTAARHMDSEGVKRLPVVDMNGRLVGIVTRTDLLKAHLRPDTEILSDIRTDVLSPYLLDDAETVDVSVVDGAVTLSGRVDRWSAAELAVKLARRVPGVVDVFSTVEYGFDDSAQLRAGTT
jgi:CBS-domain-containing membrane protein